MVQIQKVLIIATSRDKLGDTDVNTGAWAEELAVVYYNVLKKGYVVDLASVKGGPVPLDPLSITAERQLREFLLKQFLHDSKAQNALNNTMSIVAAGGTAYDALVVIGGHGLSWDGSHNPELTRLIHDAYSAGSVIAAISQGVYGLVDVKISDPHTGQETPLVAGKQVTGITTVEEMEMGRADYIPFLLESKLKQLGARFVRGNVNLPFALRSGQLITAQNPASAHAFVNLIIEGLSQGVRLTP